MADETNKPAAPEVKKSKLIPLLLIVVVVLAGAGGAWFLLHRGKTAQAASPEPRTAEYTEHLEGFTVNLADPGEAHFLRVTMDLGLGQAPKEGGDGKDSFPTARTRDALLSVLTAGKADVLMTPEGKTQLKQDLIAALQKEVPEIDAKNVYFTEFLVQR